MCARRSAPIVLHMPIRITPRENGLPGHNALINAPALQNWPPATQPILGANALFQSVPAPIMANEFEKERSAYVYPPL